MSEIQKELDDKRKATHAELDETLRARARAERALDEARTLVEERRAALEAILKREGQLRGTLGELDRMQDAVDTAPE